MMMPEKVIVTILLGIPSVSGGFYPRWQGRPLSSTLYRVLSLFLNFYRTSFRIDTPVHEFSCRFFLNSLDTGYSPQYIVPRIPVSFSVSPTNAFYTYFIFGSIQLTFQHCGYHRSKDHLLILWNTFALVRMKCYKFSYVTAHCSDKQVRRGK